MRWFWKFVVISALLCLSCFVATDSTAQTWSAPVNISNTPGASAPPAIAVDSSGTIHLVWRENTSDNVDIYYSKSTNGGTSWSTPINISNTSGSSDNPAIAIDSSGNIHLVWADITPGNYEIFYSKSTNGGTSWSAPINISNNSGQVDSPKIVTDSLGTIHLAWQEYTSDNADIYYSKSMNGGTSWSAPINISNNSGFSGSLPGLAIAIDPLGNLHLVWGDTTRGDTTRGDTYPPKKGILYSKSPDRGTSWSAPKNIFNPSGYTNSPKIAIDSSGNIHLVWFYHTPDDAEIYYSKSTDGGTNWSAPKNISNNSNIENRVSGQIPAIAIDSSGNIHLVWSDYTPGRNEIYYRKSTNGGASWSAPINISNNSGVSQFPAIAIDSSGNIHLVWVDNTPGNYEILYSRKLSEPPPPPLIFPPITTSTPIFAVAGTVTNPDGSKAAKDLEVIAENEAKGLKNKSNVGEQGEEGKYTIAFVNFENKIVASSGDILKITVKNPAGETLSSQKYQISNTDIDKRVAVVNIKIPKPSPTPSISQITVSGTPAKVGSKITVTATAIPGGIARFSISNIPRATDIQMKEISPGTYSGEYGVVSGDNAVNTTVSVSLKTQDGTTISKSSDDKITVDTILPPTPKEISVTNGTITKENVTNVEISGKASPNASVALTLSDGATKIQKITQADATGRFKLTLDLSALKDGTITITVSESPDEAGNLGEVATAVVFKDTETKVKPDFVVNSPSSTQSVEVGKSAVYVITILGKNGFNLPVTLVVDNLPKGSGQPEFNPKIANPTLENPLVTAQLIIPTTDTTPIGTHQFEVLATAGETFRKIPLTLEVKAKESGISVITLLLEPRKTKLNETIKVQGQLILVDAKPESAAKQSINLTYTPPKGDPIFQKVETNSSGIYKAELKIKDDSSFIGTWKATAQWQGNDKYKSSQQTFEFEVEKGMAKIIWNPSISKSSTIGEKIALIGQISPLIKGANVRIQVIKPDGIILKTEKIVTNEFGAFQVGTQFETSGIWKVVAIFDGNESYQISQSEELSIIAKRGAKAIVVLGGGNEFENPAWNTFGELANRVYKILKKRAYSDDDIYYLSPSLKQTEAVDKPTSVSSLEFAITQWAAKQVSKHVPLLIYLLSHNLDDKFLLEKQGNREVILTSEKLGEWLNQLPEGTPVTLIIEACHSGTFITKKINGKPVLSKPNRVIIATAKEDRQAYILPNGSSFSRLFFDKIVRNFDVKRAYSETVDLLKFLPQHKGQFPQIDANGDGITNDPLKDLPAVDGIYIPDNIEALPIVPEIVEVSPPQQVKGERSAKIRVKVSGVDITRVFGNVIPPNFNPDGRFKDWSDLAFDEVEFKKLPDGAYEARYDKFIQSGKYSIVVYAENPDGSSIPVETTITILSPTLDVNSDGEINIFDLVLVVKSIGQDVKEADVNSDGKVDVFDLVLVANHLGERLKGASPSLELTQMDYSQYLPFLERAYQLLQASSNPSSEFELAKKLLERLISLATPVIKETKLFPNYPNPFNPETWIPYQLSEDANVNIQIYDSTGRLVRTLRLGRQIAGIYISKEKAAYWDGKNEIGEAVASGVYYYSIKANGFRATRRMILLK